MYKRSLVFLCLLTITIASLTIPVSAVEAASLQAGDPYDLIAAVNNLRSANGLGALSPNGALMGIAQSQAEYNISNPGAGHTGPGGTSPKQRAYNAGYGGGATINLSENWACGANQSIQNTIYSAWSDSVHMSTMLNPNSVDIGAGVATGGGGLVCYVIDVGSVAGGTNTGGNNTGGASQSGTAAPSAIPIEALVTSTPNSDGSVVHVVKYGNSLWSIAIAYGTTIEKIRAMNGLGQDSGVYVGQKLIVRLASTLTPTPTITLTPVPPTRTPRPPTLTPTPRTPTPTRTPTLLPTLTPEPPLPFFRSDALIYRHNIGLALIVLCCGGLVFVGLSGFRKK